MSRRVNNLVTLHVFSIFGHLHDNNFSSINLYICMTVYIVYQLLVILVSVTIW